MKRLLYATVLVSSSFSAETFAQLAGYELVGYKFNQLEFHSPSEDIYNTANEIVARRVGMQMVIQNTSNQTIYDVKWALGPMEMVYESPTNSTITYSNVVYDAANHLYRLMDGPYISDYLNPATYPGATSSLESSASSPDGTLIYGQTSPYYDGIHPYNKDYPFFNLGDIAPGEKVSTPWFYMTFEVPSGSGTDHLRSLQTNINFYGTFTPVPEAGSIALGALGAVSMLLRRKRR